MKIIYIHGPFPKMWIYNQVRKKTDLLTCLREVVSVACELSGTDFVIFDGAAVRNFFKPNGVTAFADYTNQFFFKLYIENNWKVSQKWPFSLANALETV